MDFSSRHFILLLFILCIVYFLVECFFNQYSSLLIDEFWVAHATYQYKDGLPYRDFAPYKTVLGYYFLLLPLFLKAKANSAVIPTLIFIKNSIALLNSVLFFCAGYWLRRLFVPLAVCAALVLVLSSNVVLFYSTNIRVDLLAYWFCLFSLLALLNKHYWLAGILLGFGFGTSQKSIWFLVATNGALFINLLIERRASILSSIIKFNLAFISIITIYIGIWASIAGIRPVIINMFAEAAAVYHLDWYNYARLEFWKIIIAQNPFLFLLAPVAIFTILPVNKKDNEYSQRLIIVIYGAIILTCLAFYKQVFPYYMQVTIPVFIALYSALFSWLYRNYKFKEFKLISCSLLILAVFYSFSLFIAITKAANGKYQKANITVIEALLQDSSDYLAGIELIYNKKQPIAGMRHLTGTAIDYLSKPSVELKAIMLSSLYEDPGITIDTVLQNLKAVSIKFYINNYRMMALPPILKQYLNSQYEHYWGSIYLYAPIISKKQTQFSVKFNGIYNVESSAKVMIDGKYYKNDDRLYLNTSLHRANSTHNYRLKLMPNIDQALLPKEFEEDDWQRFLFI